MFHDFLVNMRYRWHVDQKSSETEETRVRPNTGKACSNPSFIHMQGNTEGTQEKQAIDVGLIRGIQGMNLESMGPPSN